MTTGERYEEDVPAVEGLSSSQPPLHQLFEDIDALDLEQGICSTRVQRIIHEVHSKTENLKATLHVGESLMNAAHTVEAFSLGAPIEGWCPYATEVGEKGEVQQTIYLAKPNQKGQWEAVPIFLMLEKANERQCSVSICLPATETSDLEWGMVCTKADDRKPVTIDELLGDLPQTNAAVLDELLAAIRFEQRSKKISLSEILHIDELHQRAFPPTAISAEFAIPVEQSSRSVLTRHLRALGAWSMLSNNPVVASAQVDNVAGQEIRFTTVDPTTTKVERVIYNLGTKEKAQILGRIIAEDHEALSFMPAAHIENQINPDLAEEILRKAEDGYNIPEIITDPELTADINSLIADLIVNKNKRDHSARFNKKFKALIETWLDKNSETYGSKAESVLSLGQINLQKLGKGSYIKAGYFNIKLSADVLANSKQEVFNGSSGGGLRLYNCSIRGADRAFVNLLSGDKLLAQECRVAFENTSVKDSIAINVQNAFSSGEASNCLAQNCDSAFTGLLVKNAAAINCINAFTRIDGDSRNLVAEYCRGGIGRLFTGIVYSQHGRSKSTVVRKITRGSRKARNMTEVNSTGRSVIASYQAGKKFGAPPKK